MTRYGFLLPTRGAVLSSGNADALAARTHADVIGLAERAEALGFDSVWAGDSVTAKPRHEPLTTLAGVATVTDGVDLGTAIYLPALRHPIHLAHQTATLDQVSGGRFVFGVGVGTGPDGEREHDHLGVPFDRRGAVLDETLDALKRLWTGEPASYEGEFVAFEDASIGFEPTRSPPVYVASAAFDPGSGFPRAIHDRVLEHGDGWLPLGVNPDRYADGLAWLRDRLDGAGRDADAFAGAYYADVVVREDEATALEEARAFYDAYYPAWGEFDDAEIRARGAFGPPEHVAAVLDAYADAGAEEIVVRFVTTANQRDQLGRFRRILD
ncbi:MAG: LLM class flavin-dependent oxidoreductase [Haloferacaceae archaeon]